MLKILKSFCKGLSLSMSIMTIAFFNPQISQASSAQNTMVFKGFHIGGNLGYVSGYAKERFSATAGPVTVAASDKTGIDGIDGRLNAGYTYVFPRFPMALGLEGLADWSNV